MSTNIHINAVRPVIVVKTGKRDTQSVSIPVWQTPSNITTMIMKSRNKWQAYFDWVLSHDPIVEEDFDLEGNSLGMVKRDFAADHIAELNELIKRMTAEGYTFQFSAW